MTKRFEERLTRIENKLRARKEPPAGPIAVTVADDGVTVISCLTVTPGPIPVGMSEFYERQEWRDRATCPDADTCPHADYCRAQGQP